MERKVNHHSVYDSAVDFYDRIATYEGLRQNCEIENISAPQLIAELQKICISIADHIKAVTGGNVSVTRMTLFFKQDENQKLWFQFCSCLKIFDLSLEEKEHLSYKPKELELTVPAHAKTKIFSKYVKYFEMTENRVLCVGCNTLMRKEVLYPIALRMVLKCYEQDNPEPEYISKETERDRNNISVDQMGHLIPPILKRMNPNLKYEKYLELKQDPYWGHQDIKLCESCYLHYTKFLLDPPRKKLSPYPKPNSTSPPSSDAISRTDSFKPTRTILKRRILPQTAFHSSRSMPKLKPDSKPPTRCTTTTSTPKELLSPSALTASRAMTIYRSSEKLPSLSSYNSLGALLIPTNYKKSKPQSRYRLNERASPTRPEFLLETISCIKSRLLDLENC